MSVYNDYVYTKRLDLNSVEIKDSCFKLRDFIVTYFKDGTKIYSGESSITTQLFANYNLLLYTFPGFHELYHEIKDHFFEVSKDTARKYYIQCWLNIYEEGQFIDWHKHWPSQFESWHGFYCVSVPSNSGTSYRMLDDSKEIYVPSEENLLVLSKSGRDEHKSTPNTNSKEPRITIAYDIVPYEMIDTQSWVNHWIPL